MSEYLISWTESRTLSFDIKLPVSEVIAVFAEHAPDVLTDAITEALEGAPYDVGVMGPVLEELRRRVNATPDDDTLDDINDVNAYTSVLSSTL